MEREQHSTSSSSTFVFPPGFRFHPSDEELITYYLQKKVTSLPLPAPVIADIDLYKHNPWELPKKALFGEDEWYFFSPRDRKYPNGARPNRAAASGYWKATGTDRPILACGGSKNIGVKKALVFYTGRPPKGTKTDWIMNEYRIPDRAAKPSGLKGSMRLDDWVLCRVRHKGNIPRITEENEIRTRFEGAKCILKTDIAQPTSKSLDDPHMGMDHPYQHCQVMASLLAGQTIPGMETTISSTGFQWNKKNGNVIGPVIHESGDMLNPLSTFSWMDNNSMKRKDTEGDESPTSASKKQNREILDECLVGKTADNNQGLGYSYETTFFNFGLSDPVLDFSELPFARFLQQ